MFSPNTDITDTLQQEIDRVAAAGGGEIRIPSGHYTVRPIALRSNICLYLEAGAVVKASGNPDDYAPIGYNHNEMGDVTSVFYAMDSENITVRGDGCIDLNCWAFYHKDSPADLPTTGATVTQQHLDEAPKLYDWRINQPIFFHQCTGIRIENITIINASCWTVTWNNCERITVSNITVDNPLTIPNSDGLHFCGSRDIIITGCHISAGDDCVALSSITDWNRATERVVVTNCVFRSASKAISIGYMHSIVRDVLIDNIIVKESNRPYVTMCHPHTGLVERIRVRNCIFEGQNYGGNWWGNGEPIVIMATPHHIARYRDPQPADRFETSVRDVVFSDCVCRAERPVAVVAEKPGLCANIQLRDSTISRIDERIPSLMGDVVDLSPGEKHCAINDASLAVVTMNADVTLQNVQDDRWPARQSQPALTPKPQEHCIICVVSSSHTVVCVVLNALILQHFCDFGRKSLLF